MLTGKSTNYHHNYHNKMSDIKNLQYLWCHRILKCHAVFFACIEKTTVPIRQSELTWSWHGHVNSECLIAS